MRALWATLLTVARLGAAPQAAQAAVLVTSIQGTGTIGAGAVSLSCPSRYRVSSGGYEVPTDLRPPSFRVDQNYPSAAGTWTVDVQSTLEESAGRQFKAWAVCLPESVFADVPNGETGGIYKNTSTETDVTVSTDDCGGAIGGGWTLPESGTSAIQYSYPYTAGGGDQLLGTYAWKASRYDRGSVPITAYAVCAPMFDERLNPGSLTIQGRTNTQQDASQSEVSCPEGKFAWGGGCEPSFGGPGSRLDEPIIPTGSTRATGWWVESGVPGNNVLVICGPGEAQELLGYVSRCGFERLPMRSRSGQSPDSRQETRLTY